MKNIISKVKNYWPVVKNWVLKNRTWSALIGVVILLSLYFILSNGTATTYELTTVTKADLVEEVSLTGKVKPKASADLAFERGGTIASINVEVGEKVYAGQVLLSLENGEVYAQYEQAKAAVKQAEAKLAELKNGARPEDISYQELKVQKAETEMTEASKSLVEAIKDAYAKSDDAIRNKVDQFILNPKGTTPTVNFNTDFELKLAIEQGRQDLERKLVMWNANLLNLMESEIQNNGATYLNEASNNLETIKAYLDKTALAVNGLLPNSTLSQTTIDSWKSGLSTARTNISTAVSSYSSAREGYKTASTNLSIEKNRLALQKAGTLTEQITASEAGLEQAQASLRSVESQLGKSYLRSPLNGLVTRQEARLGEISAAGVKIVSVISAGDYELEAYVPEADMAKVKLDNKATVTLDAYGQEAEFEAKVFFIDPAETLIDGVSTYKIKLQFNKEDERIRSGMTANITIFTAEKLGVIAIPSRIISAKNNEKTVQLSEQGKIKEVKIKTGLKGSSGLIEILSGLNEGDLVVASVAKK